MNNEKIQELDILRAISALAVITIHITAYFIKFKKFNFLQLSLGFADNLAAFAVPSFIFISGFVLYRNYNVLHKKLIRFYQKRFSKILPIYLLFSLLYLVVIEASKLKGNEGLNIDFSDIIFKLLTGGAFYHLWYFCILFQFYLSYPLLLKFYQKFNLRFLIFTFFLQLVWYYEGVDFISYLGVIFGFRNVSIPIMFSHIFWFVLGFYFLENKERFLRIINVKTGIVSILALNIIRTMPFYYGLQQFEYKMIPDDYFKISRSLEFVFLLVEILVAYKISILIIEKNKRVTDILKTIGDYSLEIYLIHPFVIKFLEIFLNKLTITYEKMMFYPIMFTGVIVITYGFAVFYRKVKYKFFNYNYKKNEKVKMSNKVIEQN